jgi:hypothetical protein
LSECGSLARVCRELELPNGSSGVRRWAIAGKTIDGVPFQTLLEEARKDFAHDLQDEMLDVMDELRTAGEDGNTARVSALGRRMQGLQWQLSKLLPRMYGDRIEHTGQTEQKITVEMVRYDHVQLEQPAKRIE